MSRLPVAVRVVGLLLLVVLAAIAAAGVRIDMSSRAFFAADGPEATRLRAFTQRWGPDDDWLVAVVSLAPSASGAITDPSRVQRLRSLQDRVDEVRGVASTWSVATLPVDLADVESGLAPRELIVDRLVAAGTVSEDHRQTVLVIGLQASSDDALATADVVDRVRTAIAREDDATLQVELAGVPAIRAAFVQLAIADQLTLQPLVYGLMALGLWIAFRRWHAVVAPLVASAIPVVVLVALMRLLGEPIGLLNQALLTLLPVIAVADAVHWVHRFDEALLAGAHGDSPAERATTLARVSRSIGRACAWTSATTAAGLASLAISPMPILRSFGLWGALGVAIAWASVAIVMPLALTLPVAPPRRRSHRRWAIVTLGIRRPWLVTGVGLGLAAATATVAARADVDNRLSDLLSPEHPVARATATLDTALTGSLTLEVEAVGDPAAFDPAVVHARLVEIQRWAAAQPQVRATLGPESVPVTPTSGAGASTARSEGIWPAPTWQPERGQGRVRIFVADAGGRAFAAFADQVRAQLPQSDAVTYQLTGTAKLAYAGVNRITADLRAGLVTMLVVITVVLAGLLRSVTWALAGLVANAWPLAIGLGIVALGGAPLDPLSVVVVTVGVGLAVDDTIHILLRAREHGGDVPALVEALHSTGRAVVVTSVVLGAGLALNMLSSFPPLRTLGLLGALVIGTAMVGDLWLLPALVTLLRHRRGAS